MKKIQLVHPPNDAKYAGLRTGYTSFPPPSGLEILATFLESNYPHVQIQIFDGNVQSVEEIAPYLDGDLVGISDWFTSHGNAIKLAKLAKQYNPSNTVVMGGPNASNLAQRILCQHTDVDFVVHGEGEMALLGLVTGLPPNKIPNLWFRNAEGEVSSSDQKCIDLNKIPIFNFDHLVKSDIAKYRQRRGSCTDLELTPVPISSIRGCLKAERQGPCIYCSMPERNLRIADPELAWRQIQHLNDIYGIDYFFETGDSFAVGNYPEQMLMTKPKGLKVRFRNYAHPDSLNRDNIRIFKELGVVEVFIGVESINSDVLHQANKVYDTNNIEKSVRLLERQGIRVFLPFLFGLPGETYESVRESASFARYLVKKYRNIQRVLFSLALPLVGTTWFANLLQESDVVREYNCDDKRSLLYDDNIEYDRLFLLSLERYCKVNFSEIYNTLVKEITGIPITRLAGFGCLENHVLKLANKMAI